MATAVLRRQCLGSAHQPPDGDQTSASWVGERGAAKVGARKLLPLSAPQLRSAPGCEQSTPALCYPLCMLVGRQQAQTGRAS
jgi:hypothetical protein